MTKKELCSFCTEYDCERTCENEKECKLLKVLEENKKLKQRLKSLEAEKSKNNWRMFPDEMGK